MHKDKKDRDFSSITTQEAVDWALKNAAHLNVRKRLRSRAVAWALLQRINNLEIHIQKLETLIGELNVSKERTPETSEKPSGSQTTSQHVSECKSGFRVSQIPWDEPKRIPKKFA